MTHPYRRASPLPPAPPGKRWGATWWVRLVTRGVRAKRRREREERLAAAQDLLRGLELRELILQLEALGDYTGAAFARMAASAAGIRPANPETLKRMAANLGISLPEDEPPKQPPKQPPKPAPRPRRTSE